MNRTVAIVGIALAAVLVFVLAAGLGKDPSLIRTPLIGQRAPAFALREAGTGRIVDLTAFRGKPVVLNFWATWCQPCWHEHPILVANAQTETDVQFIGVVFQDTEDKILAFLRQRGSGYPTVVDERGKTAIVYGVSGVPETYFLNARGVIVSKFTGPMTEGDLQANLRKARGR